MRYRRLSFDLTALRAMLLVELRCSIERLEQLSVGPFDARVSQMLDRALAREERLQEQLAEDADFIYTIKISDWFLYNRN